MKKISVIVPVYNAEKYVGRCIESIQKQTYPYLEIILVDDGSQDNSLNICNNYAQNDSRIKVLHKENTGVSNTRNMGIDNATGDFIGFVDSDDFIEPEMYETLINYIDKKTMPICTYHIVDKNKHIVEEKQFGDMPNYIKREDFFELCENVMLNSPCNKLYDIKLIKDNKIRFDVSLSLGEDFLFVLEYISYIERFSLVNSALYNYMVIERDSLSQIYRKDFYEIQKKIILRIKELLEIGDSISEKYKTRFYTFSLDLYLQALNNTFSKKSDESLKYKIERNNEIMKDSLFKICLKNAKMENLNKVYVMLLKTKRYECILIYHRIVDWIKGIGDKK